MFFIAIKFRFCNIGIWCNGNTADSGPAFPGSSPGIPTQSIHLSQMDAFFVQLISLHYFFWISGNLVGISINLCKSIQKELFINNTP